MKMKVQTRTELMADFTSKSADEQIKIAKNHYIRNVLSIFVLMFLSVCIAVIAVIFILAVFNKSLIGIIFIEHKVRAIIAVLVLSLAFTLIQFAVNIWSVQQPMLEFVKVIRKVVDGDYSARINTRKLSYRKLEFIVIGENFNQMVTQLSQVESISNDFVSNVSHEFKTPLAVIQSYATILQNPALSDEEKDECVKKILFSTKQLTDLISNILRLNKIENNQIKPNNKVFNLSSELSQCMLDFEEKWDEKELNIEFDVEDDVMINSDKELLNLAWSNLLSNAIKFTPNGGLISVKLENFDDKIIVKISDTGCGISQETQKHIFEKFYQGDTSHSAGGNGLGLCLVKRVLDITGNNISVESELEKGTSFYVTLYK